MMVFADFFLKISKTVIKYTHLEKIYKIFTCFDITTKDKSKEVSDNSKEFRQEQRSGCEGSCSNKKCIRWGY